MVYFITYDLNSEGQKYKDVIDTIKDVSNGNYCSYWESSYLISSDLTPEAIVDKIKQYLDNNDSLMVIEVTDNYQGWLSTEDWEVVNKLIKEKS